MLEFWEDSLETYHFVILVGMRIGEVKVQCKEEWKCKSVGK